MIHPILKKVRYFTIAASLLGMIAFVSAWTPAAHAEDSAHVSQLLQQARSSAIQLQREVTSMESYTRSRPTWTSHAKQINTVKEHVNKLGSLVTDLHDARDGASTWQQNAIDGILPLMQQLASNTTSAIDHLNDEKHTWHPEYSQYLHSNAELAGDLSKIIGDYMNYGKAKAKVDM